MRAALVVLASLGLSGCFFANFDVGAFRGPSPLEEILVDGEEGPKLVLLEIQGVIEDMEPRLRLTGPEPSMPARLREALNLAEEDEDVAGLLLRIQSPGGTVSASETLHHELVRWKKENEKPIVAFLQGLATSGAYYVAMAADEVIAHPTTVTGSVGVVMHGVNLSGLMQRYGVVDQTLKSGPYKDAGSPLRPMEVAEEQQLQTVIDDLFQRFVDVVDAGRPALDRAAVERLADGRVYTSNQALEAGLVDSIGHLDMAIAAAEKRAAIEESRVVTYRESGEYVENIYGRAPTFVDVNLLPWQTGHLPAGFYYIWPLALN